MRLLLFVLLLQIHSTCWAFSLFKSDNKQPDYAALSCDELYRLASKVEPTTQRWRSPLHNDKTNLLAAAVGTVVEPGYYYYGYSLTFGYYKEYRLVQNLNKLDLVRYYLGAKRCFETH